MKSHTGGVILFGRGGLFSKSTKQKQKTKSSTKAEFRVGKNELFPPQYYLGHVILEGSRLQNKGKQIISRQPEYNEA